MAGPMEWAQDTIKRVSDKFSPGQQGFRAEMETETKDQDFRQKNYKPNQRKSQEQRVSMKPAAVRKTSR